ncbi:MAG: C39 family peptidase [Clostridiales bacterium]|nr:C39 family peptidase [Clostridiales bacterium]
MKKTAATICILIISAIFLASCSRGNVTGESAPVIVEDPTFETTVETEPTETEIDYSTWPLENADDARAIITDYAERHGLTIFDYPSEFVNLLARNPDSMDFVLNYPWHEPVAQENIDVSGEVNRFEVPRFYQWDERWGYMQYGNGPMGLTGCGPTCLSMVAVYLLQNPDMNPAWMAEYAENNDYYAYDSESGGSLWTLMTDGGFGLGIDVTQIPVVQQRMELNLDVGNVIIAVVGPGDFTDGGHFIVITGYDEEGFTINDPNSIERSDMHWPFDVLGPQIQACWVFRIL